MIYQDSCETSRLQVGKNSSTTCENSHTRYRLDLLCCCCCVWNFKNHEPGISQKIYILHDFFFCTTTQFSLGTWYLVGNAMKGVLSDWFFMSSIFDTYIWFECPSWLLSHNNSARPSVWWSFDVFPQTVWFLLFNLIITTGLRIRKCKRSSLCTHPMSPSFSLRLW